MGVSTFIHEAPLRVRYSETDAAGIAHHSSFVNWLELGRVEWLRAQGISYAQMERDGYHLPVVELKLHYVGPARFDQALRIRTGLADVRSREAMFVYEVITDEAKPRQLANGSTRHICLRKGQVAKLPDALREITSAKEA